MPSAVRGTPEAAVVASLKRHLTEHGLNKRPVERIVVAADGTFISWSSQHANELEPIANIQIGAFKPDLVCQLDSAADATVVGFEVKARPDAGGVAQALSYRRGVHQAYLAFPKASTMDAVCDLAQKSGVGVMVRSGSSWTQVVEAPRPTPEPSRLAEVSLVLRGAAVARRLQLNHPLNYLVVAFVAATSGEGDLAQRLAESYPDLTSRSVIRMAIDGARSLGLIDRNDRPTPEGRTMADLMRSSGFQPERGIRKRTRLAELEPVLGAVARAVFLRQPAVQLIVSTLQTLGSRAHLPDLARSGLQSQPDLAAAVFLADASAAERTRFQAGDFNPSVVFKLKQNLWHAGILTSKALPDAARGGAAFPHERDIWALDERVVGSDRPLSGG